MGGAKVAEGLPDLGGFAAEADADVFIEVADSVYNELIEVDAFFRRVSRFCVGAIFGKFLANQVGCTLAVDLCGKFFVAGYESEHSEGNVFGLSGFEG